MNKNILIADDNKTILNIYKIILRGDEEEGFNIQTFLEGKSLLDYFQKEYESGNRPKVIWQFLEASNVNPVTEMVKLIEVQRAYEANARMLQTHDTLLGRAVNDIARFA